MKSLPVAGFSRIRRKFPERWKIRLLDDLQELHDDTVGDPPEYRPPRPQETDGGPGQFIAGETDRSIPMAFRVLQVSYRNPEEGADFVSRNKQWRKGNAVDKAGDPDRQVGADDIRETPEKSGPGKIESEFFTGLPFSGRLFIRINQLHLAAGEAQVPGPGIAVMERPFDKERFKVRTGSPEHQGNRRTGSPFGIENLRRVSGEQDMDVIKGKHGRDRFVSCNGKIGNAAYHTPETGKNKEAKVCGKALLNPKNYLLKLDVSRLICNIEAP